MKLFARLLMLAVLVVVVPVAAQDAVTETPVQFIELTGPIIESNSEISALVWHGDRLLLINENPFDFRSEGNVGKVFALHKEDILAYLDGENTEPLNPVEVPLLGPDILETINGYEVSFDGFEGAAILMAASVFAKDAIFLSIEADTTDEADPSMRGYVVWGDINGDLESITLNLSAPVRLLTQTEHPNMSYESLLTTADNRLVALFEANGAVANPNAQAVTVDLVTGETATIPMAPINFRLTDATQPDADGVFWAINYFFPGETFLAADDDPLFAQYGTGASQAISGGYERLVALRYTGSGVELVDQAPIQLLQTEDSNGRNWEGIERLDDRGLLIVTDRYPSTLLGFVPLS